MERFEVTRRGLLKTGVAAGLAGAAGGLRPGLARAGSPDPADGFQASAAAVRPRFRYWWPGAYADPDQVTREVHALADAGYGGFEIADVRNAEPGPLPPALYGWGSPRWTAAVTAALRAASARGLTADITIGPYWPALSPHVKPDDEAAAKELTYGRADLAGGASFSGPVPAPHAPPTGSSVGPAVTVTPVLLAVHAARVAGAAEASPLVLERASVVDLTPQVAGGALSWTAPAGGTWVVVASWWRGTAMIERQPYYEGYRDPFTLPQGYVVDHFGAAGSQAIVDWWEADLLTPELRTLFRRTGGHLFEDSLELLSEAHYTPRMLVEFQGRRGYSLLGHLLLVHGLDAPVFTYDDATVGPRVRWDYDQTLSDLFVANHVGVLEAWAQTLGMGLRSQPYGAPVDSALAASRTGTPEGESLAFGAAPDAYRLLSAGRDAGRRRVLSNELGAAILQAYRLSFADLVATANLDYGLGVNQSTIHGFPYLTSPTAQWPGFFPWAPLSAPINFAEAWGPRQPQWAFADEAAGYLARTQKVLQSGTNRVDVAVYHGRFDAPGASYDGTPLTAAGYSYGLVSWGLLDLPALNVRRGRLDAVGAAYKALVLDRVASLPLPTAEKLVALARAGLAIVVVGALPGATSGYRDAARADERLAALMAQLAAAPGVTRVAAPSDVPAALAAAGAQGSAVPDAASSLLHVRREDGGTTYHYLHNAGAAFDGRVSLEGGGRPRRIDAWTGAVTPLAVYDDRTRGRVSVPVALAPGESALVATGGGRGRRHVVSANADVRHGDDGYVARVTAPGPVEAVLDDGRRLRARVGEVPAASALASWELTVSDWRPANPGATGPDAPATVKTLHRLTLPALVPWTQLAGLEDVSGIGVYVTTVTLPRSCGSRASAYLSLGSVGAGSVGVKVNGRDAGPVDQLTRVVDLAAGLRGGANRIEVTVATTLYNRVRATRPEAFGLPRQDYGLLGPVTLTPYVEVALRPARGR